MRRQGSSAFIFVNNYERLQRLTTKKNVRLEACGVQLPRLTIPSGAMCIFPVNIGGIRYATAQLVARRDGKVYLMQVDGIPVTIVTTDGRTLRHVRPRGTDSPVYKNLYLLTRHDAERLFLTDQAGVETPLQSVSATKTREAGPLRTIVKGRARVAEAPSEADWQQAAVYTIPLTDGNPQDITTEVQNNVTLSTAGGSLVSEVDGTVALSGSSVTCSPAPGLDLGGITGTFTAQTEGTTTVTINLRWPDYDSWGVSTDVLQYNTAQFSFTIKVTNNLTLSHFNVAVANAVAGLPGTISFTPQPAGASYDLNNLMVDINNGLAGPWANALTSSLSSATDDLIVYEFTSTIPCQINVAVTINGVPVVLNDPSSPVGNAFSGFEIGWPFELSSGWQWRSNPCGFIPANQLATYYGNGDLIEIRTNNSLLYNDPAWGFYGTLTSTPGILQGQCYKVNMKAARSTVLMGSSVTDEATQVAGTVNMTNSSYSVTLKPGWNWVGSPYLFNRELDNIFSGQVANLKDVVIYRAHLPQRAGLGAHK